MVQILVVASRPSRHDTHARVVRVACVMTSVSRLSCVSRRACSNIADDEEAVVLACTGFFCALDLHQSQKKTSGKSMVEMSTPVHAVATPLNTCRASRACRASRDERVAPCCSTSATQHVTTFSCS